MARQASQVAKFESSLASAAECVATVSAEDFALFKGVAPAVKGGVVPIGYEFTEPTAIKPGPGAQIMFLGRMDWPPNREGLQWFLKEVWPAVTERRTDLTLAVAGSGDSAWLDEFRGLPRTKFLGRVASVEELYRESCLALVPVFYGSGTRVKAIEACRFGRPCLSTAVGVEGVGLDSTSSYFRGETAAEWISLLANLSTEKCEAFGRAAWASARAGFDVQSAARALLDLASR
jgi:glycosyltransferase involved in cell wall biosynthesis